MHAVASRLLCKAQRPVSRRACRVVADVRRSILPHHRCFHQTAISYENIDGPTAPKREEGNIPPLPTEHTTAGLEEDRAEKGNEGDGPEGIGMPKRSAVGETPTLPSRARNGKSAAGRVRGNRQRQPEGLPPIVLPEWFWSKNVKLVEGPALSGSLAVYATGSFDHATGVNTNAASGGGFGIEECNLVPTESARYSIHIDVYKEILSALRAGLTLRPPQNSDGQIVNRPITLLQCPKDGGSYYLDSVVETVASKLGADLVRLDAEDIAQIVGSYVDENVAWTQSKTVLLGYDAQKVAGKMEDYDQDLNTEEEDADGAEEEDASKPPPQFPRMSELSKSLASVLTRPRIDASQHRSPVSSDRFSGIPMVSIFGMPGDSQQSAPLHSESDQWYGLKLNTVLSTLLSATESKRAAASDSATETNLSGSPIETPSIIVQVRDYKALSGTSQGADLLLRLRTAINKRWKDGENIICVGTTSTEEGEPALSRPEIQHLQSDVLEGEKRTIFVPPDRREEQDVTFESDEAARIRVINIRHLEDMIRKLADGTEHLSVVLDLEKGLDTSAVYAAGLEDAVWTYSHVYRLALTLLGLEPKSSTIDGAKLGNALKILSSSDEAKFGWGAAELKEEDVGAETMLGDLAEAKKIVPTKERIKHIRKTCNSHEKKLLGGVVVPSEIRTTFADIRVPKETVEALKTLTTLSLIRPEAFSYGVLASDKIPGVLLYGPPGTGKTMLAKAVAKESGANVLEISGADVNDMFVGEGEKNVKAVFSLAKKLSPCVVFIDEADAIFSSRGETRRSGAHRELINQFLREWDGMNDLDAFIMVATNRPFDLDEAVLRRLPRRLLVDLPLEKDREAILNIHLKEEKLDGSVSISSLAKDTPFYSGSDLKNLSVAAALACIREENETALKHTGNGPYIYPEKRVLTKQHFRRALEEISASINEDMSTLSAIRKFDEKYGDRKGRRKKTSALGFGGTSIEQKDSEAARVRKEL